MKPRLDANNFSTVGDPHKTISAYGTRTALNFQERSSVSQPSQSQRNKISLQKNTEKMEVFCVCCFFKSASAQNEFCYFQFGPALVFFLS